MMANQSMIHLPPRRMGGFLLFALFVISGISTLSSAASSPSSSLARPVRIAFNPRGGSSSSSSPTVSFARRKSPHRPSSVVRNVGVRRWGGGSNKKAAEKFDWEDADDDIDDERNEIQLATAQSGHVNSRDEPTLEELRAQLGPVGKFVSDSIELAVVTAGSYLSGGLLGYVGGSVVSMPSSLFGSNPGGSIPSRFAALHAKAFASCKSWAKLSAAFTGFNAFVRLVRGGVEDQWNNILGSAMTGAFLNKSGGPQAMLQGGATYAGFTYFLDKFFGLEKKNGAHEGTELLYTDVPIDC